MWEVKETIGASRFGSHFLRDWDTCRRFWFLRHLAPHPDGGLGLQTRYTATPLMVGAAVHEGLAAYYHHIALEDIYDPEVAVAAAQTHIQKRSHEVPDRQQLIADIHESRQLLYNYHEWYGREGAHSDRTHVRVLMDDNHEPVIEREYAVDLGYGHVFTCRVDAIIEWRGWIYVFEHKTSAASAVTRILSQARISSQFTGECFVLHKMFPNQKIQGVLVNVLVKKRSPKSKQPPFVRDPVARPQEMLNQFEMDALRKLQEISDAKGEYLKLIASGMGEWEAGRIVFPLDGTSNGSCHQYRPCDYLEMCTGLGHEDGLISGYRPTTRPEKES